jgi:DeoR/GlpR family transcriptional regulator of sugar metabolism
VHDELASVEIQTPPTSKQWDFRKFRANLLNFVKNHAAVLTSNFCPMLTRQRHQWILERLARDGQVLAKALAEEMQTSEDTIRRDLRELAREGRLQRVHGGALPASVAVGSLALRQTVAPDIKARLAAQALRLVQNGQVLLLDGGTTCTALARQLPPELAVTVVTLSPEVAVALAAHPRAEIILLGGRLFRHSMVNVGAMTVEAARQVQADWFFLGVTGVHPQVGLSTGDAEEAAIKRALMARAADTVVMASHEKLGAASPWVIAPAHEISHLIVPQETPADTLAAWAQLPVQLIRA